MRLFCSLSLLFLMVPAFAAPDKTPARAKVMPKTNVEADLNAQLSVAIGAGDVAAIQRLMKRGARPSDYALQSAIYRAPMATWKALFAGGLSVNARVKGYDEFDRFTDTPLIVLVAGIAAGNALYEDADKYPHLALLRELIARGADVNARAPKGSSALSAAWRKPRIAQLLLDAGARVSPDDVSLLLDAARAGDPLLLRRALDLGVKANSAKARQSQLLHAALDARRDSLNEQTPLVSQRETAPRLEVVRLLLAAGVPVNDFDDEGRTPLMLAADGLLRPELVEVLLDAGADPKMQREKGPRSGNS